MSEVNPSPANDFVSKTVLFNEIGGKPQEYDAKLLTFYIGFIIEELLELFDTLVPSEDSTMSHENDDYMSALNLEAACGILRQLETDFKTGKYASFVRPRHRVEMLDGALDIAVVALGVAIGVGADVNAAANEVADNNLSKYPFDESGHRVVLKDENGKIQKPPGYRKVQLGKYLLD
jgi:hypothetical protein